MEQPSLDQIQAFTDVLELGSFSSAARRRNLTQPAISLRVKRLEEALGTKLLERAGRRMRPTPAGLVFYDKIKEIDQSVSSAVAAIAELKTEVTGRVVLAGGATFCIYILPPVLRMLRSAHPKIEIVVRTGSTRDIMMWLEDNTIDLAIVSTPPSSRHLSVKPFLSDELVAICPADEPVRPAHFTAAMLASEPLIMLPHGGGARQVIDPWFKTAGHVCKPTMELGMIDAIKRLVRAKLGYSIVPRMAVDETPEAFGIRLVPLFPPIYRTLSLVIREDKHLSRSLREVMLAFQNSMKPV